jgi:hypothetical protein
MDTTDLCVYCREAPADIRGYDRCTRCRTVRDEEWVEANEPAGLILSPEWRLALRTFRGVVPGASHYMATLTRRTYVPIPPDPTSPYDSERRGGHWSGRDTEEVTYVLDRDAARRLSTHDFTWEVGDTSTHFFDRESAQAAAIARWHEIADDGEWLVMDSAYYDEDTLLAGERGDWTPPCSTRSGPGNPLDKRFYP